MFGREKRDGRGRVEEGIRLKTDKKERREKEGLLNSTEGRRGKGEKVKRKGSAGAENKRENEGKGEGERGVGKETQAELQDDMMRCAVCTWRLIVKL